MPSASPPRHAERRAGGLAGFSGARFAIRFAARNRRVDFRTCGGAPLWHGVLQPRATDRVRIEGIVCGRTRGVGRLIAGTSG
jgi:hypothetical protein